MIRGLISLIITWLAIAAIAGAFLFFTGAVASNPVNTGSQFTPSVPFADGVANVLLLSFVFALMIYFSMLFSRNRA